MRNIRAILCLPIIISSISPDAKADLLEEFRNKSISELTEFREKSHDDLEEFRRKVNEDIARFMKDPWTPIEVTPAVEPPVDPEPSPIYQDADTVKPMPPKPVIIHETIEIPAPMPRPEPVEPIVEILPEPVQPVPQPVISVPTFEVTLYGTHFSLRKPDLSGYRLTGKTSGSYADAWRSLNGPHTNNLIIDCLAQREEKALCDWAYLQLVMQVSRELCPDNDDKANLLAGFLMSQSGYRIRFAMDGSRRLQLLYSPSGYVLNVPSLVVEGHSYYPIATDASVNGRYEICNFRCPGEKPLNFEIDRVMRLDYDAAPVRHIAIHNNPDVVADVTVNRNLIDFYNNYPEATIGTNIYSRWAIYANAPVSDELRRDLYPVIRKAVEGKSQLEAANLLIHLAESFPYGYDSEIWGRDRAFFPDESWHYPLSDCEDHAIHFTRLVRDILGLEAVLIYYPGHLASAVAFTEPEIPGDYVMHRGKRFTICDPTIFYANIGTTMAGCDNSKAVLIDLR